MPKSSHYKKNLEYLYSLERMGIHLGLARMKAVLKSLGNPQDKLSIVHIGGTNGKGSTSAMLESILLHAGYKVGLYTSPHLVRFNERIRIDGKEISDKKIAELVEKIKKGSRVKGQGSSKKNLAPTFFEFTTAMAFLYFAEEKVDFAVMEVGLGGRLDATNTCSPIVSIITNIAKDHEAMLGSRIEDIAFEKAGMIKKEGVLISAETKPAALRVLTATCKNKKAKFYRLNRDFFADENLESGPMDSEESYGLLRRVRSQKPEVRRFIFKGRMWVLKDLETNLLGRHQQKNAACALAALEVLEERGGYGIPESAVRNGLRDIFWPGRLEIVSKRPLVVLDCAHNPAGAEVLKEALCELRITNYELRIKGTTPLPPLIRGNNHKSKIVNCKSKIILVVGIMADKDMKGILSKLAPFAHTVILTRPKTERAASTERLYKEIVDLRFTNYELRIPNRKSRIVNRKSNIMLIENVAGACKAALSLGRADDIICITGSVFTVGEARDFLLQRNMA